MICPVCNTQNREDAKFCKGCGRTLHAEPAKEPETQTASSEQPPQNTQASTESAPTVQSIEPTQLAQSTEDGSHASAEATVDDAALAPTLILTHERMMEYHNRRWHEEEQRLHTQAATPASSESEPTEVAAVDISELPTRLMNPQEATALAPTTISSEPQTDPSEQPTVYAAPPAPVDDHPMAPPPPPIDDHPMAPPPPPPDEHSTDPPAPLPSEQSVLAGMQDPTVYSQQTEEQNTMNEPAEQAANAQAAAEGEVVEGSPSAPTPESPTQEPGNVDFPLLEPGTMIAGRYQVQQLESEEAHEHTYRVLDQQGYQHCWNCGSEQNAEGDEFCIDCGAELLGAPYIMHEYPATAPSGGGEHVISGNIANTIVEQGHTYVLEQPQREHNSFPEGVHLVAAELSDAGNVRRSEPNEDSTLVLLLQRTHESNAQPVGVFIVADGMGGHDSGQLASRIAINTIAERLVREVYSPPLSGEKEKHEPVPGFLEDDLVRQLHDAVEDANNVLCQVNQQNKTDMGCTVTGFMVVGQHSYIINVGDSRTYMVRGGQRYQLTTDHSLVGQLVAGGLIQPDDVYTHPQRSQIFRSLGDKPNVQIDLFKQELYPGDILLSCSDGLWEMVRDPQIESILNTATDPQSACAQLVEAANTNGGDDNVSAIVVFVR